MRSRRVRGIAVTVLTAVFVAALLGGGAGAQGKGPTLEPLLKTADLEKIGLKGVVLSPPDAYDRKEQLGFERASDSVLVLTMAKLDSAASGGTLRPAIEIIDKGAVPVSGVGDEAYSYLGGVAFAFRKGKSTFQLMTGLDIASGAKPFLTKDQLATLAKAICGRL